MEKPQSIIVWALNEVRNSVLPDTPYSNAIGDRPTGDLTTPAT